MHPGGLVQHLLAKVLAVGHPVGGAVLEVVHVDVADLGEHEGGVVVVLGDGGLRRLAKVLGRGEAILRKCVEQEGRILKRMRIATCIEFGAYNCALVKVPRTIDIWRDNWRSVCHVCMCSN